MTVAFAHRPIAWRLSRPLLSSLVLGALACSVQAAQVEVQFPAPKDMTDVRDNHLGHADVSRPLTDYLVKLGAQLPADRKLSIEFLDIDLAGQVEPVGPRQEWIRVMRSHTWPRLQLRYTLNDANGVGLRSGEVKLTDMDYLDHRNMLGSTDPLRYEKEMLREWFEKEFMH